MEINKMEGNKILIILSLYALTKNATREEKYQPSVIICLPSTMKGRYVKYR
jgi:hypothetical protein